jgi:ABC-2 type transport system permease protein
MAAVLIALKDLRQRLRDRSAYLWGIVAPLGLAFIFSFLFSGIASGTVEVSFAVSDQDHGAAAEGFVAGLRAAESFTVVEKMEEEELSADAARQMAADGEVDAAIIIPEGFSAAVAAPDGRAAVEVVANVDSPIGGQVAAAVAEGFVGNLNALRAALGTYQTLLGREPAPGELEALVPAAREVVSPLSLVAQNASTKELDSNTFYAASMAIMFLFLTVQFGVLGLLEERQNGTMGRLLAAPISRLGIVGGKALTSFVLGIVSMVVLVVATTVIPPLNASWGNSWGVAILVLAAVIAAMGVMFVVAAVARSAEQASNVQAIIAFVLATLGGAFFPVARAGGVLAKLSLITPHAWFLRGLGDLAGGGGVGAVFPAALYVALFGVVTGGLAALRVGKVLAP